MATVTWLGFGVHPRTAVVRAQIACFSVGMPVTAVYFEQLVSSAFFAASRTNGGGSKSGSPTPNANTSVPFARSSAARAFIARVTLGWTTSRRLARECGTVHTLL